MTLSTCEVCGAVLGEDITDSDIPDLCLNTPECPIFYDDENLEATT